jgi:two-component system sensor histidine kinase QseC
MADPRPALSIRTRLLGGVLGAIAITWLATAVLSYRDARREIDALLDAHLAQAAALLVAQASHEIEDVEREHAPALARYGQRVAFQVWERGRILRVHSADAPNVPLSSQREGFSDAEVDGRRWRVFSAWGPRRKVLIQVGEERAARDRIASAIGVNLVTPMAVALPLLAVLVWLGIRWSTRPLGALRAQVLQRDPANLAPLEAAGAPAEVAPLVESLNRLLARVRESMELERRFTADAAHELRTPIAAVRAHAEVARDATGDAERWAALERIVAGCDRASRAVEQLLTLARLDPAAAAAREAPCDVRELARQALADVAPMALDRKISVELEDGSAVSVAGDRALLAILARNVVDNAVRYSSAGGAVRVAVVADGAYARLLVTDQGPGIAVAERARLGQRFHRVAGSGETGTGLGLSIVLRIAELHRGRVRFADGPGGRGLTVIVELPRERSTAAAPL